MAMRWQLCVCSLGLLLLLALCALSEKFSLDGSPHPMVGIMGQDVVLPCQLSPRARLANMEVFWRKYSTAFILVHEYSDKGPKDQPGQGYQTRTELFLQEFRNGNVSLKLKRLQEADAGTYHCLVKDPDWSHEVTTELRVAAVAPVFIDVLGPQGQGIGLACKTTGWFPKPKVQWVGKNRQNLATEIVTDVTQDGGSLYSVVSHITVTEGEDTGHISCIVRNGILDMEQQSAIHLSGDIFPHASPWLAAFWVLFILVLVAAGASAYLGYKAKQKQPTKEEAAFINESDKKTFEAECQELREKLKVMSKTYESEHEELHVKLETAVQKIKALKSETEKKDKSWWPLGSGENKPEEKEWRELLNIFETLQNKNKQLESECQQLHQKPTSGEKNKKL